MGVLSLPAHGPKRAYVALCALYPVCAELFLPYESSADKRPAKPGPLASGLLCWEFTGAEKPTGIFHFLFYSLIQELFSSATLTHISGILQQNSEPAALTYGV